MASKKFIVHGKVQGVSFRIQTQEMAEALGIHGWVRNCEDGSVEVHAEGEEESLQALQEWLHAGPDAAEGRKVERRTVEEEGCSEFFIVRQRV